MNQKNTDIEEKQEKLKTYFPVLIFIVLIFLFEAFGIQKSTGLAISVFVSSFIYGIQAAKVREDYGNLPVMKPLNLFLGILSLLFILVIGVTFLHLFKILHINIRWLLFFVVLLIYFIVLFRAVHTLHSIKQTLKDHPKQKKPV